jgi:hypothetical protein
MITLYRLDEYNSKEMGYFLGFYTDINKAISEIDSDYSEIYYSPKNTSHFQITEFKVTNNDFKTIGMGFDLWANGLEMKNRYFIKD